MDQNNEDQKKLDLSLDSDANEGNMDSFEELQDASSKGSFLGKLNTKFQDVLQNSRGGERYRDAVAEAGDDPSITADDLAIRRARTVNLQRVYIPEGVIIYGSMASGSDTEISGRVEGDVTVDGRLYLGPSALISGNVKATSCKVEGLVEGTVECTRDLELTKTGRLNADCVAGNRAVLGGQLYGSISTGGHVLLKGSGRLEGNITARQICIEEGSLFNGECRMRRPKPRTTS